MYTVLYLISYAAVRSKIKRTNIFQQQNFTRVSYTIWGAYEIKTIQNNSVRNIFNAKYNQITVFYFILSIIQLMKFKVDEAGKFKPCEAGHLFSSAEEVRLLYFAIESTPFTSVSL